MEWTKFDTRLQGLIERSAERSADYAPHTDHGADLKTTCQKMLTDARALLGPSVARAQQENHDAYLTSQVTRTAEQAAENAWETLHIECQARLFTRLLEDRASGHALQEEATRVIGPWTPSAFRALGVDRSILVLETVLPFVGKLVADDSTSLAACREALNAPSRPPAMAQTARPERPWRPCRPSTTRATERVASTSPPAASSASF